MDEYRFGFKPTYEMRKSYNNLKDKISKELQSDIVYRIDCLGCPGTCIGETKQYLKDRVYKHKNDCKKCAKSNNKSALVKRSFDFKYDF